MLSIPQSPEPKRLPIMYWMCPPADVKRGAFALGSTADGRRFADFDDIFAARLADADEFYDASLRHRCEDERRVHRQALAGMLWTKQYYYFDLDRWLNEHDSHPLLDAGKGSVGTRVVPHAQQRHYLHARQVGVSLVRGVGPGFSYHRAFARRLRLRQRAAAADAAEPVRPSQRTDSRVRMEFQRRESAGARLGDAVPLQHREELGRADSASWSAPSRASC